MVGSTGSMSSPSGDSSLSSGLSKMISGPPWASAVGAWGPMASRPSPMPPGS
ncbi:MAG: hypothetical protein HC871_01800 [Rhizobiales bacterium]|nr:hypothetical protein [Hyphomicrobiales bacterium]